MVDYTINSKTLAIIPCDNNKSIVYEADEIFIINKRPNVIVNINCIKNGSTIDGRQKSAEKLVGSNYKCPILISEKENLIFFPTCSTRLKEVAWVNLSNISKVHYNKLKKVTVIEFTNGILIDFNVSLNIINNQILRSTKLEHYLRKK
ncbi:MAG: competence protein ComK [Erysipelotrichales bacterium]|nr:competence protein ComK [Erysipelotrichales bacterium]